MSRDAMMYDWNRTITRKRDERPIRESIAEDLFKASIPWHPFRMTRVLTTRRNHGYA